MTATRDTLASLNGRLDDVRREHAWRAIASKLEPTELRDRRPARRWWLWLLVPATAIAAAAAAVGARLPIAWRSTSTQLVRPCAPGVGRGASSLREPGVPAAQPAAVESAIAPTAGTAVKVHTAPMAPPPIHRSTKPVTAADLYRRAESALAARDPKSARASLERLLREYPYDALADPARYDLALIAHNGGDDARALELLDTILLDGSDASLQRAAASLRGLLVPK